MNILGSEMENGYRIRRFRKAVAEGWDFGGVGAK